MLVADDGLARFERVAVERTAIFTGGGAIRLPAHRDGWQWEPHAAGEGGDIKVARQQFRRSRKRSASCSGPAAPSRRRRWRRWTSGPATNSGTPSEAGDDRGAGAELPER